MYSSIDNVEDTFKKLIDILYKKNILTKKEKIELVNILNMPYCEE